MPVAVFLIHEAVVVDEVAAAGVVGRVNEDTFDAALVGHAQGTEGVEVIPLDE